VGPSPVNQVFQFMYGTTAKWVDGSETKPVGYLWVPEGCRRVRGVLVLCPNVPEHKLVGHEVIREMCRRNDLAVVFSAPTFMNFRKDMPKEQGRTVELLEELLAGLAGVSGYEEIATVPWVAIGESGHLLMVDALIEKRPERCIAGVYLKNQHLPPTNREVPVLVIYGSAQEWGQEKTDYRTKWSDVAGNYRGILNHRKANEGWPLTYVIDGHSGHFDCSERLVRYVADYIEAMVKRRVGEDGSLRVAELGGGFVAGLRVPQHEAVAVRPVDASENKALPWYPSRELAEEAVAISDIDWEAKSQLPAMTDADGNALPFDFNGINNMKAVRWEEDGVTFRVGAKLLEKLPENFVGAGEPLAVTKGEPAIEWLCGPVAPLGGGRFRIALDRTYGAGATYLCVRAEGGEGVRGVVQPCGMQINALRNSGAAQKITFEPIGDVVVGTESVGLKATSDAGLPVEFFVVAGPAVVRDGRLVFTPIPPSSKLPLKVTVAAWQWGRATEPRIKTAEVVRQEFEIVAAK
jgi:hypothetical protein